MHRPWILLGAWFGLLTPLTALAQPAPEAPAGKAGAQRKPAETGKAAGQPGQAAPAPAKEPAKAAPGAATPAPKDAPTAPEAAPTSPPSEANPETEPSAAGDAPVSEQAEAGAAPAESAPPAAKRTPPPKPDDDEEPELPVTPPAPDTLGGHFVISAGAAYVNPSGRYAGRVDDHAGWGWLVGGDVGFGVSRSVVIGGWGHYQDLPGPNSCSECTATSWALGPFVRFHLVQGLRFDPWMLFSVGYRKSMLDSATGSLDFSGMDWARVQVGGDWYAFNALGLGPFLELDSTGYFSRPEGTGSLRTHWHFAAGVRLVLDVPGKPDR